MLIVGALLALLCGLANSAAAALEKREMMSLGPSAHGLAALSLLVRRWAWLLAMLLSAVAWVAEAGALALAPVPVVTTLRSAGRGGLVVAGPRWLDERFRRLELVGVLLLALGGIVTASSVASGVTASPPLSDWCELIVAALAALLAMMLSRIPNGIATGAAVGVIFVATGVFTKEIGDWIVREGPTAIPALLATPGPWLMIGLSVWGISLLQDALVRANAATVSAANNTVSAYGLILASLILYRQPVADGTAHMVAVIVGLLISGAGAFAIVKPAPAALPQG